MIDIRFYTHSLWRDVNMIYTEILSLQRLMRCVGRRFEGMIHIPQTGEETNERIPGRTFTEGSFSGL